MIISGLKNPFNRSGNRWKVKVGTCVSAVIVMAAIAYAVFSFYGYHAVVMELNGDVVSTKGIFSSQKSCQDYAKAKTAAGFTFLSSATPDPYLAPAGARFSLPILCFPAKELFARKFS